MLIINWEAVMSELLKVKNLSTVSIDYALL